MNESGALAQRSAAAVCSIRPLILLLALAVAAAMVYYSTQPRVDAGFKKQLPLGHEYMQTCLDYEREFGGANKAMVALVARDGNMFTAEFFDALDKDSNQVLFVSAVTGTSVCCVLT